MHAGTGIAALRAAATLKPVQKLNSRTASIHALICRKPRFKVPEHASSPAILSRIRSMKSSLLVLQ